MTYAGPMSCRWLSGGQEDDAIGGEGSTRFDAWTQNPLEYLPFFRTKLLREDDPGWGRPRVWGTVEKYLPRCDAGGAHINVEFQMDISESGIFNQAKQIAFRVVGDRALGHFLSGVGKLRGFPAMQKRHERVLGLRGGAVDKFS